MNKTIVALLISLPLFSFGGLFNEYAEKITTGTHTFEDAVQIVKWNAVKGPQSYRLRME